MSGNNSSTSKNTADAVASAIADIRKESKITPPTWLKGFQRKDQETLRQQIITEQNAGQVRGSDDKKTRSGHAGKRTTAKQPPNAANANRDFSR